MRGLVFFLVFVSSLPFIFVSPFNGVLAWYAFSLTDFHTLIWGGPFANLNYAYVIALLTCMSWLLSRDDKKNLPFTPLVIAVLAFSFWITVTSLFALQPNPTVWDKWIETQKILFMCFVGYALTTSRDRVDQLIWVLVLSLGAWGAKGTMMALLTGGGRIHGPDAGKISDNNHFAVALIIILPLLFYLWQLATKRYLRRGLMALGVLVSLAIVFTYSRGGFLGLTAMGLIFWLRSRAKAISALFILVIGLSIYFLAPTAWFNRINTIEDYQNDGSATSRLDFWRASLRIADIRPFVGGGFNVTLFPNIVNPLLRGTDIPRYTIGKATHSSYFEVLSEHGWVGFTIFVIIGACSWANCAWLVRRSRGRPELTWANLLGRMGQAALVGYWVGGAFQSLAYLDEYWCVLFIFDAARRLVAIEIAPAVGTYALRAASYRDDIATAAGDNRTVLAARKESEGRSVL